MTGKIPESTKMQAYYLAKINNVRGLPVKEEGIAMVEQEIGYVSNFYKNISVAAIEITNGTVSVGDALRIRGNTTDCECKVDSMQIEHAQITEAKKGDSIGLKLPERVRRGDKVYKIVA